VTTDTTTTTAPKDPFQTVKSIMNELDEIVSMHEEMQTILKEVCAEQYEKLEAIDKQIAELQSKREVVQASMLEIAPDVSADIASAAAEIEQKKNSIKKAVYALPIDEVRKGLKLEEGGVQISVSKSSTKVSYSDAVLDDHPEFDEMFLDGDPLVVRRINSEVLERLVAKGAVHKDDVEKYRIESRPRNPSVRIKLVTKG
jgi:seryl-tRNA synthetase